MSAAGIRERLTAQQRGIVETLDGDVFVAAGAGSGKTGVLTARFVDLVLRSRSRGAKDPMAGTLLITFTDKAAGELAERVRGELIGCGEQALARDVDEGWVSTIHGFCSRLLRRHALEAGLDPGFRVLDATETGILLQQAFDAVVSDTEAGALLLDAYGAGALRTAAIAGLMQAHRMGLGPREIAVVAPMDLDDAIESARGELEEHVEAFRALPRITDTISGNVEGLLALRAALDAVETEERRAAAVLEACAGCKVLRRGSDEMKLVGDAAAETLTRLRETAADHVAAPLAEAFRELLVSIEDEFVALKGRAGGVDFDGLRAHALALVRARPEILTRYREQFDAVMVDEFQDTDAGQMQLVLPLARERLCVVGDERQSIYRFRYADVGLFRSHRAAVAERDPGACTELSVNFRTRPEVLDVVNAAFAHASLFGEAFMRLQSGRERPDKTRWPEGADRVEVILVDSQGWGEMHWREAEARLLAARIGELVEEGVAEPGDIVVLLRALGEAEVYIKALEERGLEVYAEAAGGFFATPEVAALRSLLRLWCDPTDGHAALGVLGGVLGGASDDSLYRLSRKNGPEGAWRACGEPRAAGIEGDEAARVARVFETVEAGRRDLSRRRLSDVILDAASTLAPEGGCLARDAAWGNVCKLVRLAQAFEGVSPGGAEEFLLYLDHREAFTPRERSAGLAVSGVDAIRVMTIHAAKGLEFPVVAVADLGHGGRNSREPVVLSRQEGVAVACATVPTRQCDDAPKPPGLARALAAESEEDREEEKRILYVACTRAEEALILSGGAKLDKPPGGASAVDWIRASLGIDADGSGSSVAGVRVDVVRGDREEELRLGGPLPESRKAGSARRPARPARGRPTSAGGESPPPAPSPLSYSALSLYERCPRRFFISRILGLGSASTGPSEALDLGEAVHAALQARAEGSLDVRRLEAIADRYRLDAAARDRLGIAVRAFEGTDVAGSLEGRRVRAEVPIAVDLDHGMLSGTIDLLCREGERALFVDYKTGAGDLAADDAADRFRSQAEVYALALLKDGAATGEVVFVELERGPRATRFEFSRDDALALSAKLDAVLAKIAAGVYQPRESYEENACGDCPAPGGTCPAAASAARCRS